MDRPLVSVIMGIYNCERTLKEAILSIQEQTYQNWEMIMCDDGSSDHTSDIAEEYQRTDPDKYILIRNERNMGLNYTLNRCLELAKGKYIARMDGDDISTKDRFTKEVEFLETHPELAIVSSKMQMFDENGVWGESKIFERPQIKDFCKKSSIFCHAASMIRADAFREVGGYTIDPRLLRVEDCHLWYKMYAKGYRGANLPEVLYRMRNDRLAASRRTAQNRLNMIYVTWAGFHMVKMPWYNYIHFARVVLTEISKIIIPGKAYEILYKYKYRTTD